MACRARFFFPRDQLEVRLVCLPPPPHAPTRAACAAQHSTAQHSSARSTTRAQGSRDSTWGTMPLLCSTRRLRSVTRPAQRREPAQHSTTRHMASFSMPRVQGSHDSTWHHALLCSTCRLPTPECGQRSDAPQHSTQHAACHAHETPTTAHHIVRPPFSALHMPRAPSQYTMDTLRGRRRFLPIPSRT